MMSASSHRIRRQRWIVRTDSSGDAFQCRQQLRAAWQNTLLPAFEKGFDQLARGDEVIRIRGLELRFRVETLDKLENELPGMIYSQLSARLVEFQQQSMGRENPAGLRTMSLRQQRFGSLLHYLHTGSVSWDAAETAPAERASALMEMCREQRPSLLNVILNDRPPASFYFRLFQLMPQANYAEFICATLKAVSQPWKEAVLKLITSILVWGEQSWSRHLQLELVAAILSEVLIANSRGAVPAIADVFRGILNQDAGLKKCASSLPKPLAEFIDAPDKLFGATDGHDGLAYVTGSEPGEAHDKSSADGERPIAKSENETVFRRPEIQTTVASPDQPETFSIVSPYSGLILLHPFLARFFEGVGIQVPAEHGQFLGFMLLRAAALLHFVAAGHDEVYEFELALIKVLLGLRSELPLCIAPGLVSEADKQECAALIDAAIGHWPLLKNTSAEGFRSAFLNRQALLREAEDGWKLRFERTGFDVLLDQLPWSISLIKLPWMTQPIYTEW